MSATLVTAGATPTVPLTDVILKQLEEARKLAFADTHTFPQVVKQVLNFLPNNNLNIQLWCVRFLRDVFVGNDDIDRSVLVDLAIDTLDTLIALAEVPDVGIFCQVIDITCVVYRMVYKYVAANDGCDHVWSRLTQLKNNLVNKFSTCFPLEKSDNSEHDHFRNVRSRIELLKFIVIVIDYQSKTTVINPSEGSTKPFLLNDVPPNHLLIKYQNMEYEANMLVDMVLSPLKLDVIVVPVLCGVLNQLIILLKRKPQFATKIIKAVETYDTTQKLQSNYQLEEEFKLARKYVDRQQKVLLQHLMRHNLAPTAAQQLINEKVKKLIDRGDEIRKRNVIEIPDPTIRKRKFEGFANPLRKLQSLDYKGLYMLNDPANKINDFDVTTVPINIMSAMVVKALEKVSASQLLTALDIISARYTHALEEAQSAEPMLKRARTQVENNDDGEDNNDYNPDAVYTLPPPKQVSFNEKRDHVKLITKNFFKLAANQGVDVGVPTTPAETELNRIAIKYWKKDLWLVLLTRMVTRGMRCADVGSEDGVKTQEMADIVRLSILDYFLENIHKRVSLVIDWLNEEWYSEQLFNADAKTPTNNYNTWSGKVLDAVISFIEPTDRNLFIRLISDLPALTRDHVFKIKSICLDPARLKIGFQSLQFLIMFRPPAKESSLELLKEMSEGDDDVKTEATKLYEKYKSG